ncbi:Gas vesicle structural protein [uncultured archaeon]|nr:Gas vesicle structural protein [uncultured archaeon]
MMKPERENTFVDVLDKLLKKGIILNADLIISVAGVPLIGINLKAALASIETMLDYGMMEAWDQSTREWYARELAERASVPLLEGENIILRTFGSFWHSQGIIQAWRHGIWHLTNMRLFLWNGEMLFETPLDRIEALMISTETFFNKERSVLILRSEGKAAHINVNDAAGFREAIEKASRAKMEKPAVKEFALVTA